MKLIRTIKKSVLKKTLSKSPYHTETSKPINNANQSTGLHTARASTERHFRTDIIIRSNVLLSKRSHHTEARQLAAMQTNRPVSTRHEPQTKGVSEQTIVIIVSKCLSPKNKPVSTDIYAIKLQF